MTSPDITLGRETEWERVLVWRCTELERAGYDTASANDLAERSDVDLHRAVELVRGGCPVEIAVRILL